MKMLISVLIVGALSTAGAFARAGGSSSDVAGSGNTMATPRLPFRPSSKRPSGTRQSTPAASKANAEAPRLPFRPTQKRPTGTTENKPNGLEAAK